MLPLKSVALPFSETKRESKYLPRRPMVMAASPRSMELRTHFMELATVLVFPLLASCSTHTSYMHDVGASPPPGEGQARVVVFRPSAFAGTTQFPIYEYGDNDAKLMGFAESGCYFEYRCPPGRHLFLTWGEGEAFIEAELDSGKTYFVRCFARFGLVSPRPGFAPVAQGSEEMKNLEVELQGLRCRELDSCNAASYAEAKEERVQKARQSYEEGRKAPRYLRPEDGR
jgi:hypothetical protein